MNTNIPIMSAPNYPSAPPAAQPVVRKVIRKAITKPAVASPNSGQEQPPQSAPGVSRSSSVDIVAFNQQANQIQAPELYRTDTVTSVASSSGRSSLLSNNPPLSPLTNITTPSPLASPYPPEKTFSLDHAVHQEIAPPSYFALCAHCNGAIPQTHATIQCLICSSANQPNIITSLCLQCYATRAPRSGHNHDISFYASDSDGIIQDATIIQSAWTVRQNSSARFWYEHRVSGYRTWITPMTAVCGLPPGWEQRRDPEGITYFQNITTGETSRTRPGSLPPGWTESKDPDGKLFFINQELQLASWCRPGQQPLAVAPKSAATPVALNTNQNVVQSTPRPSIGEKSTQPNVRPTSVALAPRPSVQNQRSISTPRPSQQQVSLVTATEATINLLDPSNGGIVRNTKIVSHIAGQGVKGTVKAVAQNQRLQTFARGTGLATANKKVKNAWRKAAQEVALIDNHRRQGGRPTQSGTQGQPTVGGAGNGGEGEFVVEYEDGTVEYYDSKERLLRTSTVGSPRPQQNTILVQRPAIQQRPPLQLQQQQIQGQPQQILVQPMQAQQAQAHQAHIQPQQQLAQQYHFQQAQPQQIQAQAQQLQQRQSLVPKPALQPNYTQHQATLVDHAITAFQHSIRHDHQSSPHHHQQQHTSHIDQTSYTDQQILYVDPSVYVDQMQPQDQADQNYNVDTTTIDMNINQNIYVDQQQSFVLQDQTLYTQNENTDQAYEVQDDDCVEGGDYNVDVDVDVDVESVDCDTGGFDDVGFDF